MAIGLCMSKACFRGRVRNPLSGPGAGGEKTAGAVVPDVGAVHPRAYQRFMKPKCDLCGSRHESFQAHVFSATNTSTAKRLTATNGNETATNKSREVSSEEGASEGLESPGGEEVDKKVGEGLRGVLRPDGRTGNRRSREAYNAYQREYMKKRRVK
jgi:hypothetical protein